MTDKYIKNTPEANFRDSLIKEYLGKTVRYILKIQGGTA